jgi:hypothetical protein
MFIMQVRHHALRLVYLGGLSSSERELTDQLVCTYILFEINHLLIICAIDDQFQDGPGMDATEARRHG